MSEASLKSITVGNGPAERRIAVRLREGQAPGVVWLGGFKSDMQGTKAVALDEWAARTGRACLRFDYSGHGESGGAFTDGTIGRWLEDSVAVFESFATGPQIVVGSSMGGWMALLLARELRRRAASGAKLRGSLAGMVLVAPAPDFTDWGFSADEKMYLLQHGRLERPNPYGPAPTVYTRRFWQSGEANRLMFGEIAITCPVRFLQGQKDVDVPWHRTCRLAEMLASSDVQTWLVKDGDHRLSRDTDVALLIRAVEDVLP